MPKLRLPKQCNIGFDSTMWYGIHYALWKADGMPVKSTAQDQTQINWNEPKNKNRWAYDKWQ